MIIKSSPFCFISLENYDLRCVSRDEDHTSDQTVLKCGVLGHDCYYCGFVLSLNCSDSSHEVTQLQMSSINISTHLPSHIFPIMKITPGKVLKPTCFHILSAKMTWQGSTTICLCHHVSYQYIMNAGKTSNTFGSQSLSGTTHCWDKICSMKVRVGLQQ